VRVLKARFREVKVVTKRERELVNITEKVKEFVKASGVKEGLVLVFSKHTTTGIFINENEEGLEKDVVSYLNYLVKDEGDYYHHHYFYKDGRMAVNAWAHLRSILVGLSVTIPLKEGELQLGSRENIYLAEFDGPKERTVILAVMGE